MEAMSAIRSSGGFLLTNILMTRGDFVRELLSHWEAALRDDGLIVAHEQIRTAIHVLENTYSGSELVTV